MFHAKGLQPRFLHAHVLAWGAAILVCGILWAADVIKAVDNFLYDRCLSISLSRETATSVLLVSASKETLKSPEHRRLLVSRLDRMGAKGIAWTTPVDGDNSVETPDTTNTWVINPDGYHDNRFGNNRFSERSSTGENQRTLVGFPRPTNGVLRWQSMEFPDEGGLASSLEASIAEKWFDESVSLPRGDFLINYSRGGTNLPLVPAGVVLGDGLVSELVRGRVVLIGRERDLAVPGLAVPLRTDAPLTPLEIHGHAVNSLLTQSWIRVASTTQTIAIVVFVSLAVYLAGQRLAGGERRLYFVSAVLGIELLAGWATLHYRNCWIPLGSLWCAQLASWLACSGQSRWTLAELVRRITYHTRTRLRLCATQAEPGQEQLSGRHAGMRGVAMSAAKSMGVKFSQGLDSLHYQFQLLESVFDQTGIGLAIFDANGTMLRINRSLSAAVSKSNLLDSSTGQIELQNAVKSAIQDQRPVALLLPTVSRAVGYQVVARPIEFRWSSPLAPFDVADVSRSVFVVCEGNLVSEGLPSAKSPAVASDDLSKTLASIEREFGGEIYEVLPEPTGKNIEEATPSSRGESDQPADHVLASWETGEAADE